MTSETICTTLRLAWIRFILRNKNICSQSSFRTTGRLATFAFGPSGSEHVKRFADNVSVQVQKACSLFAKRCNVIAGQRIWRSWQIACLYRQLYGEKLFLQTLRSNFMRHCKNRKLFMLLSAAGVFHWDRDGVSDEEMTRASAQMKGVERLLAEFKCPDQAGNKPAMSSDHWEIVVDRTNLKIWRRHMGQHKLYEYRVFGTFKDISATAFYNTQMDLEFWAAWDKQTIGISVVDHDRDTMSEVIHWIYKFPYPMYARDYCYVRRYQINKEAKQMIIRARAVKHPKCPEHSQVVRVTDYQSEMVIEPHKTFDENGFDYCLTYFDDPQTQLPAMCYNWLASTGVPEFVERLHTASKYMQERMLLGYCPNLHTYQDEISQEQKQQAAAAAPAQKGASPVVPNIQNYA